MKKAPLTKRRKYIYYALSTYGWAMLLFVLTLSCEQPIDDPYETFVIPEGKHNATLTTQSLQSDQINFSAIFDESAIYESKTAENQHDINKLVGFSDCNAHHHQSSARFGWRWLNDQIEILAYVYGDGERQTEYIGAVNPNDTASYHLKITEKAYVFRLNDFDEVAVSRAKNCDRGLYYMLFPYFGGDEKAPHDISIKILFRS